MDIKNLTQTATGVLLAVNNLNLSGDTWLNVGRIETDGQLVLALGGGYSGNGVLLAQDNQGPISQRATFLPVQVIETPMNNRGLNNRGQTTFPGGNVVELEFT